LPAVPATSGSHSCPTDPCKCAAFAQKAKCSSCTSSWRHLEPKCQSASRADAQPLDASSSRSRTVAGLAGERNLRSTSPLSLSSRTSEALPQRCFHGCTGWLILMPGSPDSAALAQQACGRIYSACAAYSSASVGLRQPSIAGSQRWGSRRGPFRTVVPE